jgi:hypothetical protein
MVLHVEFEPAPLHVRTVPSGAAQAVDWTGRFVGKPQSLTPVFAVLSQL